MCSCTWLYVHTAACTHLVPALLPQQQHPWLPSGCPGPTPSAHLPGRARLPQEPGTGCRKCSSTVGCSRPCREQCSSTAGCSRPCREQRLASSQRLTARSHGCTASWGDPTCRKPGGQDHLGDQPATEVSSQHRDGRPRVQSEGPALRWEPAALQL